MTAETDPDIPGWFDFQEVYDRASKEAPADAVFVEIGAWFGRSTVYLANCIRERAQPGGRLFAVDTWQGSPDIPYMQQVVREHGGSIYSQFLQNIKDAGVSDIVQPMCMSSAEAAQSFKDESIDFIFIDGCHRYDQVLQDLKVWFPKLKPGGAIAGHDYQPLWPGVVRAVHEFFNRETIGAIGNSFWVYKPDETPRALEPRKDPSKTIVLVPVAHHIEPACDQALRRLEACGYTVRRVFGQAAIDQARSQMATDALTEGFEELMWIDADIGFEPEALDRLRSYNLPVVCGLYAKKGQRALACYVLPGTKQFTFGEGGGLVEILYGATGFLLVRKQAFLELQSRMDLPICNTWAQQATVPYFLPMITPRNGGHWYLGEDFAFFERLRQCGYRIFADTAVRLWHIGRHGYSWEEAGTEQPRYATYHFHMPD